MSRSLAWVLAVGCSGCAIAGVASDNDGSPPTDGSSGSDHGDGSGSGSNSHGTCAQATSGVLATWTFTGAAGDQSSTAVTSTAPGGTASIINRSSDLVATTGASSINSNNWPSAASRDPAKGYYAMSVTPPAGCTLSLTAASIDTKASATGPASVAVATAADNFGTAVPISTTAVNTPTLSVTGATGAVEVRIYGYGSTGMTGTLRVQNTLTLSGAFE